MKIFGKSEAQEEFIDDIEEEFTIRASYILLLGFSAVIATLGLLTNSASVVIGSMLISPLFWPVLGISLSIVLSDRRLIRKAIYSFGVSVASVFFGKFFTYKACANIRAINRNYGTYKSNTYGSFYCTSSKCDWCFGN